MARILATPRSFAKQQQWREMLEKAGHEVVVKVQDRPYTAAELLPIIGEFDAFIAGVDEVNADVIKAGARLKVIARNGVGYNQVDVEAAKKQGIRVTLAPGANSISVCELAFTMMMELARNVRLMDKAVRQGSWSRQSGRELYGKTLGVFGTGNIGREVIRRAHAFGMKILAYDLYQNQEIIAQCGVQYTDKETIFKEADYITLHAPVTPETTGLVCKDTLKLMKPDACIINTARGELIVEDDLYEALTAGTIRAAALDVFNKEPLTDTRFWKLENVVLTPHTGAYTQEASERTSIIVAEEVLRVLAGQEPLYPVV